MSESGEGRTEAAVRRSRWPGWIWAVPIAALAIVGWLGVRAFVHHGPKVEITFKTAGGVTAGQTKVIYKDVEVGDVEDVELSKDWDHVLVSLRMHDDVAPFLTEGTRFWIVGAKLDLGNLSALKTIVSGPYIEMDPGPGKPSRHFAGLEQAPPVAANSAGTRFVLHADRLGSVGEGSPVDYLGLQVGKVEGYKLVSDGSRFDIDVFVRAPYDKLVRRDTRFWDAGAVRISTGGQGIGAELVSPQALLSGAVAFETPSGDAASPPADPGATFRLYDGRDAARAAPVGQRVPYLVRFEGAVGDLSVGAAVKLKGFRIGEVVKVGLVYDVQKGTLETPVTIEVEPARFRLDGAAPPPDGDWTPVVDQALERLVEQGFRARLERSTPIIGGSLVSLELVPGAKPAKLDMTASRPEIPTASSSDIGSLTASANDIMTKIDDMPLPEIAQSLHETVDRLDSLASSPAVEQSLQHLDRTLAHLDRITQEASGKVGPLIEELRNTADAAQAAVASANDVLGGGTAQDKDLPAALHELTDAARSIRALANYLDRHPEALLQGKAGGSR